MLSYLCSVDGARRCGLHEPEGGDGRARAHTRSLSRRVDRAGNVSAAKTIAWTVDTSTDAPVITIWTTLGRYVELGHVLLQRQRTRRHVHLRYRLDDDLYRLHDTQDVHSLEHWQPHCPRRGTDAAGNVATSAPYTWKIDPAAPVVLGLEQPAPDCRSLRRTQPAARLPLPQLAKAPLLACSTVSTRASCTSPQVGVIAGRWLITHSRWSPTPGLATEAQMHYTWTVDTVAPNAPSISGPTWCCRPRDCRGSRDALAIGQRLR